MKKLVTTITILISIFSMIMAQPDRGMIYMELSDVSSDNPEVAAQMEMMKGSQTSIAFRGHESVTSIEMMGGMFKITIKTSEIGDTDMLMDVMGQKMWIPTTREEKERAKLDNPEASDLDISYDEEDTKEIAGYQCIKMILENPANPNFKMEAYVAPDLKFKAQFIQGVDLEEIKGIPLEYSIPAGPAQLTFTTTKISEEVDDSVFEISTDGFKQMTLEEFQQQMGGLGF